MKQIAFCAAALATALCASTAYAGEPKSATVIYGDLDLQSDEGIARFDRRIGAAVDSVCDYRQTVSDRRIQQAQAVHRCRTDTLASVAPARQSALDSYRTGRVEVVARLDVRAPVARR